MTIMSIGEEQVECPLCMEPLEMDDINFFPCTCGYQICRFCWHRIRTDENGLCPACRKTYQEDPAEFRPLSDDELQRIKKQRKIKDLQRKQKAAESRKHLANVRVVQKNLVFVVGLSQRLGDVETLKKHDYFGKFGKMVKVVINQSTSYAGSQVGGPSASAYITYQKPEDALRAIQAVNNIHVDGRTIKASLGTTKYCSHFLKGTQCPKGDCMYLHELGEEVASFTKDEMQQGKHTEYEQRLIETYMNNVNSVNLSTTTTTQTSSKASRKKTSSPQSTPPDSISPPLPVTTQGHKDAWPSLSSSGSSSKGSNHKRTNSSGSGGGGSNKSSQHHHKCPNAAASGCSTQAPPHKPPSLLDVTVTRPPGLTSTLPGMHSPDTVNSRHSCSDSSGTSSNGGRKSATPPHATHTTTDTSHIPPLLPAEPPRRPTPPSSTTTPAPQTDNAQAPQTDATPTQQPPPSTTPTEPLPTQTNTTSQSFPLQPSQHTSQLLGSQRGKSLFGDPADNMSLFGLSGFTPRTIPNAATSHTSSGSLPLETAPLAHDSIPETISVNSSTDWSAAFGFKPSELVTSSMLASVTSSMTSAASSASQAPGNGAAGGASSMPTAAAAVAPLATPDAASSAPAHTHHDDDDLGFDPWNESTKALQDLMEKESSSTHHVMHSGHFDQHRHHTAMLLQQQQRALQEQQQQQHRAKASLPPGFTPNHVPTGFPQHNPMLGGSRMMSLMKLSSTPPAPGLPQPPAHGGAPGLTRDTTGAHMAHQHMLGNGCLPDTGAGEAFTMKDWQEGLRALLPNINISFGAAQFTQQQQQLQQQAQLHKQQQLANANQTKNYDLLWDPAVVSSGNVASEQQNGLPEEPHWMASLHTLTDEPITNGPSAVNHPITSHNPLNHVNSHLQHKLLPFAASVGGGTAPGFVQSAAVTTPPPGFQHPMRTQSHPLVTDRPTHPLADAFQ